MLTHRATVWLVSSSVAGVLMALAVILVAPRLLHPPLTQEVLSTVADPRARVELQQSHSRLQNETRSLLLQGFAGLLVVLGAVATWRQVQVARDGYITDRFTRAVDQLGSENTDVRVGGIYALERVARNSPMDRPAIQYILGAFVRGHAPWVAGAGSPAPVQQHPTVDVDLTIPWLYVRAPAIQATMNVLGRRPYAPEALRLYLSRVDLRSVNLNGANLTGTRMRYANLARAWLTGARLDRSDLKGTDLRQARAVNANLAGAFLQNAYLEGADLRGADLRGADLCGADVRAVNLDQADLTGCRSDAHTRWPTGWDEAALRARGVRT